MENYEKFLADHKKISIHKTHLAMFMDKLFSILNLEFILYFLSTKNISHYLRTRSQVNLSSNNNSGSGLNLFY